MKESFKERLRRRDTLVGTVLTLPSPEIAELLSDVGFDWLFVDTEHAPLDARGVQSVLQATGTRCPCLVRVPAGDEVSIKKVLDVGPAGVIVPHVNSAEDARRIVQLCKYPPEGSRSVGVSRAHGYGLKFQEYVENANQTLSVVLQIEHIQAVRNIESIVAVPGFDAVFVGPYDLSGSMGMIGHVTASEVQREIERVKTAAVNAGLALGIFGVDAEALKPLVGRGYTLIAVGTDTLFTAHSAKQALAVVRG